MSRDDETDIYLNPLALGSEIENLMDIYHYSESEIQDIHNTIKGIQQAINTIDEQLINGTLPTQDENKSYKQFLNLNGI